MKLEYHEGSSGAWGWRLFGDNGQVFAIGATTYKTEKGAREACDRMAEAMSNDPEIVRTPLNPEPEQP